MRTFTRTTSVFLLTFGLLAAPMSPVAADTAPAGVTRAAGAVALWQFAGSPAGPFDDPGFADVATGMPGSTAIGWLAATGVTVGRADGTFGVDEPLSRAAFASMLYRLAGAPDGPYAVTPFTDVNPSGTHGVAIGWLWDTGLTTGISNDRFGAFRTVSQRQLETFVVRFDAAPDVTVSLPTVAITPPAPVAGPAKSGIAGPAVAGLIKAVATQGITVVGSGGTTLVSVTFDAGTGGGAVPTAAVTGGAITVDLQGETDFTRAQVATAISGLASFSAQVAEAGPPVEASAAVNAADHVSFVTASGELGLANRPATDDNYTFSVDGTPATQARFLANLSVGDSVAIQEVDGVVFTDKGTIALANQPLTGTVKQGPNAGTNLVVTLPSTSSNTVDTMPIGYGDGTNATADSALYGNVEPSQFRVDGATKTHAEFAATLAGSAGTITISDAGDFTLFDMTVTFSLALNNVTIVCDNANVGDTGVIAGVAYTKRNFTDPEYTLTAENAATTCTSGVTDMGALLQGDTAFNESIGHWDTSNVTNMRNMFLGATAFNQPIGDWDTSNVTDMTAMFENATVFNQPIGDWDTSIVTVMDNMFFDAANFDQDLSGWHVTQFAAQPTQFDSGTPAGFTTARQPQWGFGLAANGVTVICPIATRPTGVVSGVTYTKVDRAALDQLVAAGEFEDVAKSCTSGITDMAQLFENESAFNGDISHWDTSNVTDMGQMFRGAITFNQPIGDWDTSNVADMRQMFQGATAFNQHIGAWNTSNVTIMNSMFASAVAFNQPIGHWVTSNVTGMNAMFNGASKFNQPIGDWDTSQVTTMANMFVNAAEFNQPIGDWDTSHVTATAAMFINAVKFNQPIGGWVTINVTDMRDMFQGAAAFNQPIGGWDTSKVAIMNGMFRDAAAFNQDLSDWCVELIGSTPSQFSNGAVNWTTENRLPIWGTCPA